MTPARLAAARTLVALETTRTTLAALTAREQDRLADPRDRGLFLEIVNGTVRWRGAIDACLEVASRRPVADLTAEVRAVVRTGAYQLLYLDRVPSHAAVSEAVDVVRTLGHAKASGFVNAVLRGLQRRNAKASLPKRPADATNRQAALRYLSVTLSHPEWLVARWLDRLGFDETMRWCEFNNRSPTLTCRPLPPLDAPTLEARLREHGVDVERSAWVPHTFRLTPGTLGGLPDELRRSLLVQDEGSQLVAGAAGVAAGDRVVDLCAAPGGKTIALAGGVGPTGLVVACDHRPARVRLLKAHLRRAGVSAPIVSLDASQPLPFHSVFDCVLLDAPCSGLGTLRRDPDLKWSREEADLDRFAGTQRAMIGHASAIVRPGGRLIYATCSSEPEENEDVVSAFLTSHREFRNEPIQSAPPELLTVAGHLRTWPFRHQLDAFFAAQLVRFPTA